MQNFYNFFIGNPDVGSLNPLASLAALPSANLKQRRYYITALSRLAAH